MQLATLMRLNALSCAGFGAVFTLAPAAVAGFLGTFPVLLVHALGVGLMLNAVLLGLASWPGRNPRRHEMLFFCAGDLAWVVASVVLLAAGLWITTIGGQVSTLIVALGVGAMGAAQWRRKPPRIQPSPAGRAP